MSESNPRTVLLNTLLSRSVTKAREHKPPTHGAKELFELLEARRKKKWAVEYFDTDRTDSDDEDERISNGEGHNCIRLKHLRFEERDGTSYVVGLIEFVNADQKSFSVVHMKTFAGREIEGEESERGAVTAHFAVRLPDNGEYDDGKYRIAIESVHGITRRDIEILFCRQLRRHGTHSPFDFLVSSTGSRAAPKRYLYTPRLELAADRGRKLESGGSSKTLTHMVFTKRDEKQHTSAATTVTHEDFYADVEMRVSATQGPDDPGEKISWAEGLKNWFQSRGYKGKYYFRHADGGRSSGQVIPIDLEGAADLLMCPRETIFLDNPPKPWVSRISSEIAGQLQDLLERDELWERSK